MPARPPWHRRARPRAFAAVWVATILLFGISALVAPGTMRAPSLLAMLPFAAMLVIVAIGQTLVIQHRGIDMSAGGMMTLGGVVAATLGLASGSAAFAVLATLVIMSALGAVNGLLVARLGITPIVATLATNALLAGTVHELTGGSPIAVGPALADFAHERWAGVPATTVLAVLFVALVAAAMNSTPLGRRFVAVGQNPRAAASAGIAVRRYQVGAYAAAAACYAVAGMLCAGFLGSASHTAGDGYLLPGIAAVIVGGTSLAGGRGSVVASGVAALFMTQLGQLVLSLGAGSATQMLVQAGAIVVATALQSLAHRSARRRRREAD